MAFTKFDICSRAFVKLGNTSIQSFSDGTKESEVAGILYEGIRDSMISSYYWNFATKDFVLSKDVPTPIDTSWKFAFTLPGDCLEVTDVYETTSRVPVNWTQQSGVILSNDENISIKYRSDGIDENDYPAYFVDALVARLSYEFSESFDGEGAVVDRTFQESENKLRAARRIDAQANPPVILFGSDNSSWVGAFNGGE